MYEYVLAYWREIEDLLKQGWEPVPHTQPVLTYQMATPSTYHFLRRSV